jgi:hypothetical protein
VAFCGDFERRVEGNRVRFVCGEEGISRFPSSCNNCRPGVFKGKRAGVFDLVGEGVAFRAWYK